jgi:hypothetical protein
MSPATIRKGNHGAMNSKLRMKIADRRVPIVSKKSISLLPFHPLRILSITSYSGISLFGPSMRGIENGGGATDKAKFELLYRRSEVRVLSGSS